MSRFHVNVSKFEQSSLSDKQVRELFVCLEQKLPTLIGISDRAVRYMKKNRIDYRLITVGTDYVITIRKSSDAHNYMCLGYPFPIITKICSETSYQGFQVSYYIRGGKLRLAQRANLIQKLQKNTNFVAKFYKTKYGLRHALARELKNINHDVLYYIDLYRFIGDSFLSTYMLDVFARSFNVKKKVVLSKQFRQLSGFYDAKDLDAWARIPDNGIYVFSDLLDIDDAWLHDFAVNYAKDGIYIVNSRNYFFVRRGNSIQYFAMKNIPDVLLAEGNIFPYMKRCVSSLVKPIFPHHARNITANKIKRIYINPFSSSDQKSLSISELDCLVQQLRAHFNNLGIIIPFGHDAQTKDFSANVSKVLKLERLKDDGFYDLINQIQLNNIDLIVTPDTALTHVATKCGIKNIVIFKSGFWDALSIQSLAAESPLSFCSSNPCQLPVVIPCHVKQDFKSVLDIIRFIQSPNYHLPKIPYNFCSWHFSLIHNIRLAWLSKCLGAKHKLTCYKKVK